MKISEELRRAITLLRAGRLVAFPTETVYGLGANALDPDAVARVYAAKGRPASSPLIVHVGSIAMAKRVVSSWPEAADKLAAKFWPGPLTLVLPKASRVPDSVTAGLGTVGVRIPAHTLALTLIRRAGIPLAAPSANRFTQLSPVTASQVRAGLGDRVDMVVDGGPCRIGIESTVLSLAGDRPRLLRPGMVSREQLEAVIGPVEVVSSAADPAAHESPGQHERHYAPRTRLVLGVPRDGERTAYLWWNEDQAAEVGVPMPRDPDRYAAVLYDTLHRADALGVDVIAVEPVPPGPDWDGIRDRLQRAAKS